MSLIDELSRRTKENDEEDKSFKTYSEAVLDFFIVLIERFIFTEVRLPYFIYVRVMF